MYSGTLNQTPVVSALPLTWGPNSTLAPPNNVSNPNMRTPLLYFLPLALGFTIVSRLSSGLSDLPLKILSAACCPVC